MLGSAGGPRQALHSRRRRILIVNGDTLSPSISGALTDAHLFSGALVTLALVPNQNPEQYGGVRLR